MKTRLPRSNIIGSWFLCGCLLATQALAQVAQPVFPIQETSSYKARPALPPMPERTLNFWRFDSADWWLTPRTAPLAWENVVLVPSWSGYALQVLSDQPAWLRLPVATADGRVNLACDRGALRFWFCPAWSSTNAGGTGPGTAARLIELGAWTLDASRGWWSLYFNTEGSAILFSAQRNGQGADYLVAPIAWQAPEQLALPG
jgi:hypothetical protein